VHLGGAPSGPPGSTTSTIIQQIFTGALQSDVTCSACGAVSTTIDPFWDISLDVRPIEHMPTPHKASGHAAFDFGPSAVSGIAADDESSGGSGGAGSPSSPSHAHEHGPTHTLVDCLNRYVRTEQLSSSIYCDRCESRQQATKRMSMSELPMVITTFPSYHTRIRTHTHARARARTHTHTHTHTHTRTHTHTHTHAHLTFSRHSPSPHTHAARTARWCASISSASNTSSTR
jgi:hypothetical protein